MAACQSGLSDSMRLSTTMLDADTLNCATRVLFGAVDIAKPSGGIHPLYLRTQVMRENILAAMPTFDEKGLEGDEFIQEGEEAEEDGTEEDAAGEDEEVEGAPHVPFRDGSP